MSPWSVFESVPSLVTFPSDWQLDMGDQLPAFKALCLDPSSYQPRSYPCPRNCGCWHRIIRRHDGTAAIGACQCNPPNCPDIELTIEQITPLEVNRAKLGRAICQALLLNSKPAEFALHFTAQIGSWSADAVPVILTIQSLPETFQSVVADLVAQIKKPFILMAPTSRHLTAHCQSLLSSVRAAFFPLETTVTLTHHRTLLPAKPPGELFAQFTPSPRDAVSEDTARQLFALSKALDSEKTIRKAPPSTVLRLYCVEHLEPDQIAIKLGCARSLVYSRLDLLSKKLGRPVSELRQYSSYLEKIEASLSDPRASRIHRKSAIDDAGSAEEPDN